MPPAKRGLAAYRRIYEALHGRAMAGDGATVSETALMAEFDVSRDTARKALNLLTRDGFARRIQGRGTVLVAPAEGPRFDLQVPVNERFFRGVGREPLRHKFYEIMDGVLGGEGGSCRVQIPLLRPDDPLEKQFSDLTRGGAGVLFLSHSGLEDLIALMRRERYPHVVHAPLGYEGNLVASDARGGVERALETLAARGRRRILFASPGHDGAWQGPMHRTWKETLTKRGLETGDELIFNVDARLRQDPVELAAALGRRRFDAVFSTEAELSLRLLGALRAADRPMDRPMDVPMASPMGDRVSFISYEDLPEFETARPPVSAVRVPLKRIGACMREEVLAMMRFGYRDDVRIALEEELVLRGSE